MIRFLVLCFLLVGGKAWADSCDLPVRGYSVGAVFSGPVIRESDGDTWRVAVPGGCLKVRFSDFDAPERGEPGYQEARRAARSFVGRQVTCEVQRGRNGRTYSWDRIIAQCSWNGQPIGDRLRAIGIREGGR